MDAVSYNLYNVTWVRTRAIFSKLGWCASDMTLCHTTCAPEPGFGRGSILFLLKGVGSQDYGVQVICRCVISLVRPYGYANVQAYGVLNWHPVPPNPCHIMRAYVCTFVWPYGSDMTQRHMTCTPKSWLPTPFNKNKIDPRPNPGSGVQVM